MVKNCDNCIYSGRPSYEYPCTACEAAYGSAPSKWESMVSATADMVKVVRCKDCKYGVNAGLGKFMCDLHDFVGKASFYCASGERKDND